MLAKTEAEKSDSTPRSTTMTMEKSMKHSSATTQKGGPPQSQEDELCEILMPGAMCYALSKAAAAKERATHDNTRRP